MDKIYLVVGIRFMYSGAFTKPHSFYFNKKAANVCCKRLNKKSKMYTYAVKEIKKGAE